MLKNICVFCASSEDVAESYKDIAAQLGRFLAAHHYRLVYGGAQIGLMGQLAANVLAQGGEVIGVIPEALKKREIVHTGLTKLYVTEDMQTRQRKMADLADAFIILPGGLGTLAEFFEVLTWKSLNLHEKPIIVLNHQNYWDALLKMVEHMEQQGFLYHNKNAFFTVADDIGAVKEVLKAI